MPSAPGFSASGSSASGSSASGSSASGSSASGSSPPPHPQGWRYVTLVWLTSRLFLALVMVWLVPQVTAPSDHFQPDQPWAVLTHWDGEWYESIATQGYEFAPDGQQYNVAFFPLFPLVVRLVMGMGLPFGAAAALVSQSCFWLALGQLYRWMVPTQGAGVARWSVLLLAWFPYSYYCSVAYTESLFLWVTVSALAAFDQGRYGWAGLWGALASATRLPKIWV